MSHHHHRFGKIRFCYLLILLHVIIIGLLAIKTNTQLISSELSDALFNEPNIRATKANVISIDLMQQMFNSASSKLIFNLSMKNISNFNSTCLANDPCQSFGQLFQSMKTLADENMKTISKYFTFNILFIINIESSLSFDDYGDFNLPSKSSLSYYFLFQSSKKEVLNFPTNNLYLQMKKRTDIAWIIFNNLKIINFKIFTFTPDISYGYTNCILESSLLSHGNSNYDSSQKNLNFLIENSELISTEMLTASFYLIYYKGCRFFGDHNYLEITISNQIVFMDISMQEATLNIPIYGSDQVVFQNGTLRNGYFVLATLNVKQIHIENVHVIECTKVALMFSLFYSQYIKIVNSSIKNSGGAIAIRSTLKVELVNVRFDGNYITSQVSETLTSPISFNIVDQLFISNVTVQNHNSHSTNAFAVEILENTFVEIRECNFVNNKIGVITINNQLVAASSRYSIGVYKSNFMNNTCNSSGCGLNLNMVYNFRIDECKFENNYSPFNGSSIFGTKTFLFEISNSKFQNNTADMFGGSIYINMFGRININFASNIQNCKFIENKANHNGGGLYINHPSLKITNSTFVGNNAEFGGAVYSFYVLSPTSLFYSCSFSDNYAVKYGPNFLSFAKTFSFGEKVSKNVKPGERITVNMTALSYDSEPVPLNSMPNFFLPYNYFGKRIYLHIVQEASSIVFTPFVVNQPEIDNEYNISIIFKNSRLVNMYVINCSSDEQLKPFALASVADIYACEKIPVLSITLLIAILIPSLIIVFGLGILASICVMKGIVHIQKRLSLLRKKEIAEKSVEKRIIDKQIIFGDSYEPLLDDHHSNEISNYDYGQEMKVRSFIIPVSEISIEKKLAEGGQGVVYKGLWNNSQVAIKSLKSDQSEGFETEVSLLASLRHPFILTLYGISITNENKYMITEFLEGGSLEKLIYSCKIRELTLSLTEKVNILKDISSGMNYLHTLNPPIIHRDLKPANVLLDKNNRCKIADFGLSLPLSQSNTTMTKNIGTFFYMSPESIQSETTSNHNSSSDKSQRAPKIDVFSFAIIMWELFFEVSPYSKSEKVKNQSDGSIVDVISKVLKGERPNIPFVTETELDEWLLLYPVHENQSKEQVRKRVLKYCELVRQCWHTNPMERPSFSQIVQILNEISN